MELTMRIKEKKLRFPINLKEYLITLVNRKLYQL